jgi:pimeloyl-ACP methyl ester carboxylesterase
MPWSGVSGSDWASSQSAEQWWENIMEYCPGNPDLIIGHSFGATVILNWARQKVNSKAKLLFIAPLFLSSKPELTWEKIDHFARTVPDQLMTSLYERIGLERYVSQHILKAMALSMSSRVLPGGIIEMFSILKKIAINSLEAVKGKITIVRGDLDTDFMIEGSEKLTEATSADQHVMVGAGHIPMAHNPEFFQSILSQILTNDIDCSTSNKKEIFV